MSQNNPVTEVIQYLNSLNKHLLHTRTNVLHVYITYVCITYIDLNFRVNFVYQVYSIGLLTALY